MRPSAFGVGALFVAGAMFAGCATGTGKFVLLPDHDGHVGAITVTTDRGAASLDEAGEMILISNAAADPQVGPPMSEEAIAREFSAALAAEPAPPRVFLFYFRSESAEPNDKSAALVDKVVEAIQSRQSYDISINGHTDRSGEEEYNMTLSLRRAERLHEILLERGVNPAYMSVDYHGEGDPVVPTADGVHEPRNRRVEVVVR